MKYIKTYEYMKNSKQYGKYMNKYIIFRKLKEWMSSTEDNILYLGKLVKLGNFGHFDYYDPEIRPYDTKTNEPVYYGGVSMDYIKIFGHFDTLEQARDSYDFIEDIEKYNL